MDDARPIVLTVDDDPAVSRAVARDLRRKYGESHRVVRAESGADALGVLDELTLRGGQVALILSDQRMPGLDGVAFLEQAMDRFPRARRVLLTAYADTDAAIRAINDVDIDHYLLKPWDPPEERLYPIVDQLLTAWLSDPDRPVTETKVVGQRLTGDSFAIRDFLARNSVPYRWYGADQPEGRRLVVAAGIGDNQLPLVVTPDGSALTRPTIATIADRVGLSTTPSTDFYDVVIVGGGPAGLGAAVYAASEGLRTLLMERQATGGQAGQSSRIENYLGFPDGVSGAQLTERARRQATRFGAELLTARDVAALTERGSARVLRCESGLEVAAHTVLLSTGVSYRTLDAPGVAEVTGRGVFYGAAASEAPSTKGEDVYVVGGANSAGQAAVYFSRFARSVTLLVRGDDLTKSMSHYLIQQLAELENVHVRTNTSVAAAHGGDRLEGLTLLDSSTGTTEEVTAGWMFVFIGAAPRTEWLGDAVTRDRHGFVLTGPDIAPGQSRPAGWPLERPPFDLETSMPGVFAAGDVRSASVKRVASAVGEGAMAISQIHRYLEKL
jgi:thioredoxin reductase (NADPH)